MSATWQFCSRVVTSCPGHPVLPGLLLPRSHLAPRTHTPIRLTPDFLTYLIFAAQTSSPTEFVTNWTSMENLEQAWDFASFRGAACRCSVVRAGAKRPPLRLPHASAQEAGKGWRTLKTAPSNSLLVQA